jgi:hypothetical protein
MSLTPTQQNWRTLERLAALHFGQLFCANSIRIWFVPSPEINQSS